MPALAAIRRDFGPGNAAAPTPGKPRHLVETRTGKLHLAGRKRDHRFRFHGEAELARFAAAQQVGVFGSLLARHERLIAELQTTQPFYVSVALPTRQNQPQRVTLLRPQRLSVLRVG